MPRYIVERGQRARSLFLSRVKSGRAVQGVLPLEDGGSTRVATTSANSPTANVSRSDSGMVFIPPLFVLGRRTDRRTAYLRSVSRKDKGIVRFSSNTLRQNPCIRFVAV